MCSCCAKVISTECTTADGPASLRVTSLVEGPRNSMGFARSFTVACMLLLVGTLLFNSQRLPARRSGTKSRQSLKTATDHSKQSGKKHKEDRHAVPGVISVACTSGKPCSYPDHVDLRVIVMTRKRPESRLRVLESLDALELDGDRAALEIWVDRTPDGNVHQGTLTAARQFRWSRGPSRVHIWDEHVGAMGQWFDSWRPKDSSELALILEDDLTISPFAYRWLRAAHNHFGQRNDVAGYTLQGNGADTSQAWRELDVSGGHSAFLYQTLGKWGYAPHPERWREFQDWFHQINRKTHKPYVPNSALTSRYQRLESKHQHDDMWEMWHIQYCHRNTLYTVYSNLRGLAPDGQFCLAVDATEQPHRLPKGHATNYAWLVVFWKDEYIDFPETPVILDVRGKRQRG